MEALLEAAGSPHTRLGGVIHIAGTNGKGSTAAMLDSILRRAGGSTGRFTSPHLESYCERFVFGGQPITWEEFGAGIGGLKEAAEKVLEESGEYPLQFEILTALAYVLAAGAGVRWLVQETGLGGAFDATNIISNPRLTIITNIHLDHTERLGSHPAAIARDKAGILKPGVPVITAARGSALEVIAARAGELGSPLHVLSREGAGEGPREEGEGGPSGPENAYQWTYSVVRTGAGGTEFWLTAPAGVSGEAGKGEGGRGGAGEKPVGIYPFTTPLPGEHQGENGSLAAAAAFILGVPPTAVAGGLARTEWAGRLEMLPGDPPIVLDGAHNPAGMQALRRSVDIMFPGARPFLICGMQVGKDALGAAEAWHGGPLAGVYTVDLPGGGGIPPSELAAAFQSRGISARPLPGIGEAGGRDLLYPAEQISAAAAALDPPGPVVIAGSFYLVGALRPWLKKLRSGSVCLQKR